MTRCEQSFGDYIFERNGIFVGHPSLNPIDLSNANLSKTDLSYSDLSGSIIIGCKYFSGLKCKDANFYDAIIDNKDLVMYLRKNGALEVPEAEAELSKLEKKLSDRVLHKHRIEEIVKLSLLHEV